MMGHKKQTTGNSLFEKNLNALRFRYPDIYNKIQEQPRESSARIVKTGKNESFPNILFTSQDRNILYYDSEDPMGYAREYINSLDLKYAPFLIFLGFGLGYQVISALNDFAEKQQIRHIFIIEKDIQLFKTALNVFDLSQVIMHPDIELFIGYESPDLFVAFRHYFAEKPDVLEYLRNMKFFIMPAAHYIEKQYYTAAYQVLKDVLNHVLGHVGNDPYDSLLGLSQTFSNLGPIIQDPGIRGFKDRFKDKPGVVIGAGPSLNKNIHLLKEAQHKAVLVAVDAALKPLLDNGITPHMVTNIERTEGQDVFFLDQENLEDTFFVFSPVVPHDTYEAYNGPKIIAHRYKEIMNWLDIPKGALAGGPLVGNFAYNIAEYLGCNPIILVGQDFSFKSAGTTHVSGMVCGDTDFDYKKNSSMEVEGNYNEILLATRCYVEGRKSLEVQIENNNALCINATEGGAKIRGSHFLSLRDAIDNYCKESFDSLAELKKIWATEKTRQPDPETERDRVSAILDSSIRDLDSAITECQKGIKLINSVTDRHELLMDGKPNPNIIQMIMILNRELNEIRNNIISSPSFVTFETVIQSFHIDLEMRRNFACEAYHDPKFATLKTFLLMKEWFTTVGQLILSTRHDINEGKNDLYAGVQGNTQMAYSG